MGRVIKNMQATENQTIVSGPCIAGRKTAGSGGMEELSGEDVAEQLPAATASAAGKATAAQIAKLDGIAASADATGFLGNYTTSQIAALTGMSAGNWVRDSSRAYRPVVYNGTFWLPPGHVVLQNRTGAASVAGTAVQLSASYDFAVELPNIAESDIDICGIVVTGGVSNGSDMVVDVLGGYFSQVLVQADDQTVSGYYMVGLSGGLFVSRASARLGCVGRALETKNDAASNYLVWVLTSGNETV
jgi:hypothetical protein